MQLVMMAGEQVDMYENDTQKSKKLLKNIYQVGCCFCCIFICGKTNTCTLV